MRNLQVVHIILKPFHLPLYVLSLYSMCIQIYILSTNVNDMLGNIDIRGYHIISRIFLKFNWRYGQELVVLHRKLSTFDEFLVYAWMFVWRFEWSPLYIGSLGVKLILTPFGIPNWVWLSMNQYKKFFVQTSILPPSMDQKLIEHAFIPYVGITYLFAKQATPSQNLGWKNNSIIVGPF